MFVNFFSCSSQQSEIGESFIFSFFLFLKHRSFLQVVAISLIYMALKMTKLDNCDWIDRRPNEQWWDQFVANLTSDMMEEVSFRIAICRTLRDGFLSITINYGSMRSSKCIHLNSFAGWRFRIGWALDSWMIFKIRKI